MLSREDNDLLTQSGPSTPMGQLLRRFWMPVLLSAELPKPDCPPKRVRVLGENLLAFRDTEGRVGLVDPVCPHRGADLYYGRNEECGLRCIFHGLKFDVHGACVDIPIGPPGVTRERFRITAYPTRESSDIIWAWMGPPQNVPPLPMLEFTLVPPSHRYVSKKWQDCNWVQCLEGGMDTAHLSFLHMAIADDEQEALEMLRRAALSTQEGQQNDRIRWVRDDPMPKFEIAPTDVGLTVAGARRADNEDLYWRVSQFLMPNHGLAPSAFPGENYHGQTWVPVGDDCCWIYTYTWNPDRPLTDTERELYRAGHSVHAEIDENYVPLRTKRNDYLIDREAQKRGSYTGIQGVSEQDAAVQDSQGPIADRTREGLFATDMGLVKVRQLLMQRARALQQEGAEPAEAQRADRYALRSGGWIAHQEQRLPQVMVERFGDAQGHRGAMPPPVE